MNKKPKYYTLYSITCLSTNKIYVGVCLWWQQRKCKHLSDLRNNVHLNIYLQKDFNTYTEDSFVFDVIQTYKTKHDACLVEKYYTDVIFGLNKDYCYNILSGGNDVQAQITKRHKDKLLLDQEYRNKISEIRKESQTGKKFSQISKDKMRDAKLGKKASCDTIMKMKSQRQGSMNSNAKKVINEETGIIYGCLKDATSALGLNYDTVRGNINGYNNKKTTLRWL